MTTKMTRRTFLKGAAAAAAAVSQSGLLTGCGGDQELPDNAVQLGVFNVSIYGLNVDQGGAGRRRRCHHRHREDPLLRQRQQYAGCALPGDVQRYGRRL